MIKFAERFASRLAVACDGNPVLAIISVFLFYVFFSLLEAMIEKLVWGERFEHWLDPLFIGVFMAYAGWVVWVCAEVQVSKMRKDR